MKILMRRKAFLLVRAAVLTLLTALCLCGCRGQAPVSPGGDGQDGTAAQGAEDEEGIEEICLAVPGMTLKMKEAVAAYNLQSERYQVVIQEAQRQESYDDYRTRLQLQLAGGRGPDLLADVSLVNLDAAPYVRDGYLLDVTDFAAEQGLMETVTDSCRVDGRLYGIPVKFSLGFLCAPKEWESEAGDGWTAQACMQKVRESGADVFAEGSDGWDRPMNALYVLALLGVGQPGRDSFVDEERRVSAFGEPESVEMLEFVNRYADPGSDEPFDRRMASGQVVCGGGNLNGFNSFSYLEAKFGGDLCYIGFPSPQGSVFELQTVSYYVNASSPHQEGALDFLAFLLSDEQQRTMAADGGFPVTQELLETLWEEAKKEPLDENQSYVQNGISYSPRPVTDREEEIFWGMLDNLVYYDWQNDIYDIVWDEALPYFSGDKSAQEAARIIDSRVQLYLDENG